MSFKKNTVLIDGKKVFYWEKNRSLKKVVVLLHGFPGNHNVVTDMAKNIAGCRVIVPDLPACGQSEELTQKHTLGGYSKWLNGFTANLFINEFILIGYSFGSRVAITFASSNSKKVKKMVLITPVVRADGLIARLASLEYEIAEKLPGFMQKTWLSNKVYHGISNMIIFKSASKKRRQYLIDNDAQEIKHLSIRANLELFNEFFSTKPISNGSKINTDTLIIAGDKDEIATVKSVKELCARFTNFEITVIKNSGHIVIAERPKKVARIINNWLSK
ncbi:MAG: alpha/beta hydrolase [Candidatus Staskawiczbacteria bacterium]|nr:alpha/beta hydrolase [Candidatus Staskawiczbacteria bacterium]